VNQLAPIDPNALPRLPQAAEAALMRLKGGAESEPLPQHVRDAAQAALPAYEARAQGADAEAWQRFLLPLAMMVRNPPGTDDIRRFAHACAAALQHIPASCLSPANQRAASREFAFWPAAADLAKLLEPDARDIQADVAALRRIAAAPLLAGFRRDVETPEQRAANAEKNRLTVEVLKEEFASRQKAATPIKPAHIGPEQRIAYHRQRGDHATADASARANGLQDA
jgi:hypothetical protein